MKEAYTQSLSAKHSFYCITGDELAKSYKPFLPLLRHTISEGGSSKIITSIDKSIIRAIKELVAAGAQIRHINAAELRRCVIYDDRIVYFSIVEPTITSEAIELADESEGDDLWIASTEPSVIQSAKKRFMKDWEHALSAEERIKELENGEPAETTTVIRDNKQAIELYQSMASNAQSEVLYLLPTSRALTMVSKVGIIESLVKAAKERSVKIRVLCPIDSENISIIEYLETFIPEVQLREHESTASTVLIVDGRELFISELRNNDTDNIYEALSFPVYSNSRPTIESYTTLFESLWKQKELYDQLERSAVQLELANEHLKVHDRLQREFINIAAHELRTPIQPILGITEIILQSKNLKMNSASGSSNSNTVDEDSFLFSREDFDLIVRNAKRLERLASDILEIARIESDSLQLRIEQINLNEVITTALQDLNAQAEKRGAIQFEYIPNVITLRADKERLTQVIFNLIDNAIKFTENGKISITTWTEKEGQIAVVAIKDSGSGIDSQILPRLFEKFVTKSERGLGLGLFISKSIIEAHGGKIWAENNRDDKGATFTFELPTNSSQSP